MIFPTLVFCLVVLIKSRLPLGWSWEAPFGSFAFQIWSSDLKLYISRSLE